MASGSEKPLFLLPQNVRNERKCGEPIRRSVIDLFGRSTDVHIRSPIRSGTMSQLGWMIGFAITELPFCLLRSRGKRPTPLSRRPTCWA